MEGTTAPAAPSPAVATANGANGPQNPAPVPKPKPNVTILPSEPARAKPAQPQANGTQEEEEGEEGAGGAPKKPEPYRFKRKIKVDGKEDEIDLDEEGILREVQISRAYRSRLGKLKAEQEALEAKEKIWESDPIEAIRARGIDPEKLASYVMAQRAKRHVMSPEEQKIADLEAENQNLKKYREQEEVRKQEAAAHAADEQAWRQEEPLYMQAMEKAKLPRDMFTLGIMAKVGHELTEALGEKNRPSPEHIVAETNARLQKMAEHYVLSMSPERLAEALGEKRLGELLKRRVDAWRTAQAEPKANPTAPKAPAPSVSQPADPRRYKSSADVDRDLNDFLKAHR